jgi:ribonuclease HII
LPEWPWDDWSIESLHGADLHCLAVAGASILAKVTRDNVMKQISEDLEMDVGSGYPSDPKTIEAVVNLVQAEQPHDCLRWGWATVKNAWESVHSTPLPMRPADPDAPPNAQRTLF